MRYSTNTWIQVKPPRDTLVTFKCQWSHIEILNEIMVVLDRPRTIELRRGYQWATTRYGSDTWVPVVP